ncbi:MAG: L-histidine N(alpha)-methyltransferase [Planctomycetota bacterium]
MATRSPIARPTDHSTDTQTRAKAVDAASASALDALDPSDPSEQAGGFDLIDLHPSPADLRAIAVEGLSAEPKSLPAALLYDAQGSALFESICDLPEYYLTRTEVGILRANLPEIAERIGPGALVFEPGCGSGVKTRLLLETLDRPAGFVPIEISRSALLGACAELARAVPGVEILPVCADYHRPIPEPSPEVDPEQRVVFFPGSTVGNAPPDEARVLLERLAELVGPGGWMLVGVDLRKDPELLEAAYDDAQGVTARFTLNVLERLNREADADFDLDAFGHEAVWRDGPGWVELGAVSLFDQTVSVAGQRFAFARGEKLHTEVSAKYTLDGFAELAAPVASVAGVWTDAQARFSVQLLRVAG